MLMFSLALLTHAPHLSPSVPSPQKKTFAVLICVFFFFLFPLSASDPLQAIAADIATAVGFLLSLSLFRLLVFACSTIDAQFAVRGLVWRCMA